jgi:hypothetical protein
VDQQVTAPTPDATSVENSRDLQGIRVRIRPSFVEVNVCRAYAKRAKIGRICGKRAEAHSNMTFGGRHVKGTYGPFTIDLRVVVARALDFAHSFR